MINTGLSVAQQIELIGLLKRSHRIDVVLDVLDLDHNYLGTVSDLLLGGQVDVDATADIQRMMTLDLFDPNHQVTLDPNDPGVGTAYPTRMIRCIYRVGRLDGSRWFNIPLFCGPVTGVSRDGWTLNIECSGKEVLTNGNMWKSKLYRKNTNKISLIINLLSQVGGERYMDFPTNSSIVASDQAIDRENWSVWGYARWLANTMGYQMFYDGRGYARIRTRPSKPVYVFDDESLRGDPKVDYDLENLVNAVEITGATPSGKKTALSRKVEAASSHPLSPAALGRTLSDGTIIPRYFPLIEQNDDLNTQAKVDSRANSALADGLLQGVDVQVPTIIIPNLEEDDLVSIRTDKYASDHRSKKFTIPLTAETVDMSLGYNQNVKPSKLASKLRRSK